MPYFLVSCLSVSVNQFSCKQCMAARAVLVVLALDTRGEQEDRGPSAVNGGLSRGQYIIEQHVLFSSK